MIPDPIKNFIALAAKLPGIGPRQATRIAFYLIRQGNTSLAQLAGAISRLETLKTCAQCFTPFEPAGLRNTSGLRNTNVYESTNRENEKSGLCHICSNPQRNQAVIAIVEKETDVLSLEKAKHFTGRYLVLGELAKDGVLESGQKLRLNHLKADIKKRFGGPPAGLGQAEEIIIAVNPSTVGAIEADIMAQELKPFAKKITRLGRGLPTGGEIEFADEDTLTGALENRR